MKILLIFFGINKFFCPPLGILTLATILKKNGYDVFVTDRALYADEKALHDYVLDLKPDVLGLSVISMDYDAAIDFLEFVKENLSTCKIIVGGPHATALPELVAKNKNVDLVSIGESENTILEIMDAIKSNGSYQNIKGVAFRNKNSGQVIFTEKRCPIADLNTIPIPDRSFLPMKEYFSNAPDMPMPFPATSLIASRGCYGNCMYCQPLGRKLFGASIRRRSPAVVVDEIEYLLNNYPIKSLWFVDDEPTWNGEDWMAEICNLIHKRNLKFSWYASARVDQISDKLLSDMKKAGCVCFSFGVESGSERILKIMRKGYHPRKIKEAMDLCRKHKMVSRAQLMVGTPGETRETLDETLQMVKDAKPDLIGIGITTPTPGSDLYEQLKNSDKLRVKHWRDFDRFVINPIKLEFVTPDDLRLTIKNIYRANLRYHLWTLINPVLFIRRFYFIKAVFWHMATQLKSPKVFWSRIKYYLSYSKMRASSREVDII